MGERAKVMFPTRDNVLRLEDLLLGFLLRPLGGPVGNEGPLGRQDLVDSAHHLASAQVRVQLVVLQAEVVETLVLCHALQDERSKRCHLVGESLAQSRFKRSFSAASLSTAHSSEVICRAALMPLVSKTLSRTPLSQASRTWYVSTSPKGFEEAARGALPPLPSPFFCGLLSRFLLTMVTRQCDVMRQEPLLREIAQKSGHSREHVEHV